MKILFMLPYSPVPPTFGGAMRIYHLIKLALRNHDVSILSFGSSEDERELRSHLGSQTRNINVIPLRWHKKTRRLRQFFSLFRNHSFMYLLVHRQKMQDELDHLLETLDFDIVQTEYPSMGSYQLNSHAIKILDSPDVQYDNFRQTWHTARTQLRKLYYRNEYKKFYREEIEACNRYDVVLLTSARDKQILDADIPIIPKYVIPNGVDASYFIPSSVSIEPWSLVFTGAMGYIPNYDGMLYFIDEILPHVLKRIPAAKVYIVGDNPPKQLLKKASHNVIITGYVEDVRPYVWRSSVYIVPLRMGSGTRLKVLEAMAMKKPIVSTSIGCEGIDVVNGESVIIADEPQAFAESIIKLLYDNRLCEQLINNGYELMKTNYEWQVIGDQLENLYQELYRKNHLTTMKEITRIAI
ncbi:MAG: glycosyltransferase [Ignavibacteriae bacterium]|nr:glycosyltransferase [Ignavibacteriota bacterium]